MQQAQRTPARKFNLALTVFLLAAAAGIWAMSAVFASKPTTVGARAPAEASAVMSPMELMVRRGRQLPVMEYVEPF